MGKILLWLKSMGGASLPMVATVTITVQVGITTIQESNTKATKNSVEDKIERIESSKATRKIITVDENGVFQFLGSVIEGIESPVVSLAKEVVETILSPFVTSAPIRKVSDYDYSEPTRPKAKATSTPSGLVSKARAMRNTFTARKVASIREESIQEVSQPKVPEVTGVAAAASVTEALPKSDSRNVTTPTSTRTSTSGGEVPTITTPGIVVDSVTTGTILNAMSVSTSTAVVASSEELYLAAVSYTDDTNFVASMTGLGLTWTQTTIQCSNMGSVKLELWYAYGAVGGGSIVTADLNTTSSSANIIVSKLSGVDLAAPISGIRTANFHGVDGAATCGAPGTMNNSFAYTLDTIETDSVIYSATTFSMDVTHTAVGMTESGETNSGGPPGLASNLVVSDLLTSSSGTYDIDGGFSGNARWSSIAIELKPLP